MINLMIIFPKKVELQYLSFDKIIWLLYNILRETKVNLTNGLGMCLHEYKWTIHSPNWEGFFFWVKGFFL